MAQPAQDITNLERLPHLEQNTLEAVETVEKRIQGEKEEALDPNDPKLQESYEFNFDWKDFRKHSWTGKFTNKILSITDRQLIGVLQAQWQDHRPASSIDPEISSMNYMLAHMSVSLKQRPEWAKDLRALKSVDLVQMLYREVMAHEATFHGYQKNQSPSESEG